jgi:hypothetical protein
MQSKSLAMAAIAAATALVAAPAVAQQATQQATCQPIAYGMASDRFKKPEPSIPVYKTVAEKTLYQAAAALGMVRLRGGGGMQVGAASNAMLVADAIHKVEFSATGTWNGQPVDKVTIGLDAILPATRIDVQRGAQREIQVASAKLAWDESKPGVFSKASTTPAADRYKDLYLLPWGAVFAGVKALDKVSLSTVGGMPQLTIATPLGNEVKLTLDSQCYVVRSEMTYGGRAYTAEFSDYVDDAMEYDFYFPKRITIKADGRTLSDLTVIKLPDEIAPAGHNLMVPGGHAVFANPYLVFPIPPPLRS